MNADQVLASLIREIRENRGEMLLVVDIYRVAQ